MLSMSMHVSSLSIRQSIHLPCHLVLMMRMYEHSAKETIIKMERLVWNAVLGQRCCGQNGVKDGEYVEDYTFNERRYNTVVLMVEGLRCFI